MSRTKRPLSQERIAPCDLEAFVTEASPLHQRALASLRVPVRKPPTDGCPTTMPASSARVHSCR